MNCPSCGTELPDAAKFCGSCGYQTIPVAQAVGGAASAVAAPSGGAMTLAPVRSYDEIAATPADLGVGDILSEGWETTKPQLGLLIGGMLVVGLIYFVAANIPFAGLVLGGPLFGGVTIAVLRLLNGREVEFSTFFDGFKKLMPLALVGLVSGLLAGVGFIFLLLPGLYLSLAFMFGSHLVIDRDEEFWPAMMASMKVVNGHFGFMALWGLTMFGLAMAGVLTCGLGFIVLGPLIAVSNGILYKRLFGIAGGAEHLGG